MNSAVISNTFFSKATIANCLGNDERLLSFEMIKKCCQKDEATFKDLFSTNYLVLSNRYRNEYFYKNTLFNQIILEKHKIETTVVFTEFKIGRAIADFVALNGKSIIYEIKTEHDSLDRIERQVKEYYKASPYVCIVTSKKHLNKVKKLFLKTHVGIYYINDNNRIVYFKKPTPDYSCLKSDILFSLLRKKEYEEILKKNKINLPVVKQVEYYSTCKKEFATINIKTALKNVISTLKKRKTISVNHFSKVPYELKMLVYESDLNEKQFDRFLLFLNKNINNWR